MKTLKTIGYISNIFRAVKVEHGIDDKMKVIDVKTKKITSHTIKYNMKGDAFITVRKMRYYLNDILSCKDEITL